MRFALFAFLTLIALGYSRSESEWVEDFLDEMAKHDLTADASSDVSVSREETTPKSKIDDDKNDESDEDDDDDLTPILSIPNIFTLLRSPAAKPWWMGDHVCVEKTENEPADDGKSFGLSGVFLMTGTARYSTCQNGPNKYVCTTIVQQDGKTTKSTIIRKCCKGFRLGSKGCEQVETKPFDEVAKDLKAGLFARMAEDENLKKEIEGPKTIFLPLDTGMDKKIKDLDDNNNIITNEIVENNGINKKQTKRDLIENHIVDGLVEKGDFVNDMVLTTINNGTIRINGYPGGIITANCVPFNKTDKFTQDGVVHVLDKMLDNPNQNIIQILDQKYPKFKKLLENFDLLKNIKQGYTVLAVKDDNLNDFEPEKVSCLQAVLSHHIVPRTVCLEGAKNGKIFSTDSQGEYVAFEQNEDGKTIIGGKANVINGDILAKDGVVHEIDMLISPQSAIAPLELLRRTNHTRFMDLIEKSGLKSWIEKAKNITLFVPVEDSLGKLEKMEKDELTKALKYHIGQGKHYVADILDSDGIPTEHGENIQVTSSRNIFSSLFGPQPPNVGCAKMTRVNGDVCNGVAHEVSKPISPPKTSILDVLKDPEFSTFKNIIKDKSEFMDKIKKHGMTLLAVKNDGFSSLNEHDKKILKEDPESAERFLMAHILGGHLCCSQLGGSPWPFGGARTNLLGQVLPWESSPQGVKLGGVKVEECDITAKDGVVHVINKPLITSEKLSGQKIKIRRPGSEIILAGF